MFDPVLLHSFLEVSRTLNFSRAAVRMNLRQSTVSAHVRKLEAACGRPLFVRDTHSVTLTSDGEAMIGFATSIVDINERALRHFRRDDLMGVIRLGLSEDLVLSGFTHILRQFTTQHPAVMLELTVNVSEALRDGLNRGDLDLILIKRTAEDEHGDVLWREPLVWIAAPDFRLLPGRAIPLILLAPPALTRSIALSAMENSGGTWRLICTSGSQSGIHAAVAAGLGVAPHARSLVPAGLVELNSPELPPLGETEFVVIGSRRARSDPWRALVETIRRNGPLLRRTDPPVSKG